MSLTCGEATMQLLGEYGVTTVFGIPGVHTLELCRGLTNTEDGGGIRHIQARNEQGAGFMAEGWARATGEPGVAVVISGPGVTNATTALAQCYADSLPLLLISAEPERQTLGKGFGVLHEITEQKKVTEPVTALSVTAQRPADIPLVLAKAFTIFKSQRPRPVHLSIPTDVQAELVSESWLAVKPPNRPAPVRSAILDAVKRLSNAQCPIIMIGGGAVDAGAGIAEIATRIGAVIVSSTAAKGTVPDNHALHLGGGVVRRATHEYLAGADCILALGTELSETDSFDVPVVLTPNLIRVDLDPAKINDQYPAAVGLVGDTATCIEQLLVELGEYQSASKLTLAKDTVTELRATWMENLNSSEQQHCVALKRLRTALPDTAIVAGDACQIIYTGCFAYPSMGPRQWFFPAGYCALGNALPNAIGAMFALPNVPVVAVIGDGGFMFTMPELLVAAEHKLSLPIIIWDNGGYKQIKDDMEKSGVSKVGVEGLNPNFRLLADACHCLSEYPDTASEFEQAVVSGLTAGRPTLIVLQEGNAWLIDESVA